jgi:hypothetical protein
VNTQKSTAVAAGSRNALAVVVLSVLQACSTIPETHMVLPAYGRDGDLQALSLKTGAVADVLTVTGEERVFTITPSTGQALAGQLVDPNYGVDLAGQYVTEPFDSLALVYYADLAKKTVSQRDRLPTKPSYPKLKAPDAADQALSCDGLAVELARAEGVRWFARNEGAMAYTDKQRMERHAANFTEDVAITAAVILIVASAGYGGGSFGGGNFGGGNIGSSALPGGPSRRPLEAQVGGERLRWAVTAADSRIIGLLGLRRDKGCAGQPTLVTGRSDLQNLGAIEAMRHASADRLSDEAMMHEQTRLLDELGPLALVEASNRNCGLSGCSVIRSVDVARDEAVQLRDQAFRDADAGVPIQQYSSHVTWARDDGVGCEIPKRERWNQGSELVLGSNALMWASATAAGPWWTWVRLTDIDAVLPTRREDSLSWIALRKHDGTCLFFAMQSYGRRYSEFAQTVSAQINEQLNSSKQATRPQLSANP